VSSCRSLGAYSFHYDSYVVLYSLCYRYLYLFSLADGQCLTSLQVNDSFTREQLAPKDRDVLFETYIWCHLHVTTTQQVNYTVKDELMFVLIDSTDNIHFCDRIQPCWSSIYLIGCRKRPARTNAFCSICACIGDASHAAYS
jgi:hypothetical protein